ncbi:DUF6531 domain-containing protein [Streptomyces sp. CA-181903]|uniref:DUF6531 domain-containing protein n=1 Tax=Streptomyces sp. CA-181903 TaxID=3240055 RepID=UPI003D92002F
MSLKHKVQSFLVHHMGLYWPDGDAAKLRKAAKAWRAFAESVDDIRGPVNNTAGALIHNNKGEAIEAFETFWGRYAKGKDAGWLSDVSDAAKEMAKACDKMAAAIDHAVKELWEKIAVDLAVLATGVALAIATGGALSGAAAAAAEVIIAGGASVGIAVTTTVAEIAGFTLAAAAFGGLEAVTVDLAVAQPMKISLGLQKDFDWGEADTSIKDGMLFGGAFGGAGSFAKNAAEAGGVRNLLNGVRPGLAEEFGAAARLPSQIKCELDPIDVATGAMLLPQTDVTLPGALPLVVERTHVSSYRAGNWFGPTWASTLDERVQLDPEGVVFAAADGMRLVYPIPVPGEPVLPVKGPRWALEWDGTPDGMMTVTDPYSGVIRTFAHPAPCAVPGAAQLPLESVQDRNGMRVDIERTLSGTPTAIRHSGGYYVAVDTDGPRVTALRLLDQAPSQYEPQQTPGGGTLLVRYGYDDAGNLTEVVNSSGKPLRFTYDAEGRVTSWTDRNGASYSYVYDERGRVVRTEGSDGFLSGTLEYGDGSRTTTVTSSLGRQSFYRWDADGHVVEEVDPLGHTTRTEWDSRGENILSRTDPLGRTTRYAYDETGNLAEITLPDGSTVLASHDDLRRPIEVTGAGGATWRHAYDERGNRLTTTDPTGAETHYAYDASGGLVSVTDALGHTRRITCDAAGLPLTVTDPLGNVMTVRRDAFGRIAEAIDSLGQTTRMEWTTEGKPRSRVFPDGRRETWTWDGEGNLLTHTDPAGNATEHAYGPFDLPTSRTGPDGATYDFAYDTELRLVSVTNPQAFSWSYEYDEAGRLTAETDFSGRRLTYVHDAAGQLESRTNGAGETIRFSRDVLGRTIEQSAGSQQSVTTYAYDGSGRLTRTADGEAEIVFERDALGRVVSEAVNGRAFLYAYDLLGRRTQRTTPSGLRTEWTYDAAGRATGLRSEAGSLTFAYDAVGRETERRLGEGATLTQTWDSADRLTAQSITGHHPEADRLLQHRSYAYREDGHLAEIRELTSGTRRFDLDTAGRVTGVRAHGWTETYAYDTAGNLTHASAPAHGAPGKRDFEAGVVRRAGRTTYEHDAQGRLVRKTRKLLSGQSRTWTYCWDAEDRLTSVVTPNGEQWRYAYDPLGRRMSKHRLSDDGSTAEAVAFAWEGTRLAEQTAADGRTTTWDYVPGTYRPLAQTDHQVVVTCAAEKSLISHFSGNSEGDGGTRFHAVVTDLIGTPTELVTPDGELVWQRRTGLWGTHLPTPPDSGTECPMRFPGQYYDAETGLHYNYFRHYDPETGCYLTHDPLGLDPAPNPKAYVDNPFAWVDPLGLTPCTPGYRAQSEHPDSQRLSVDSSGNVSLKGDGQLYVNLSGDISHSLTFRGGTGEVIAFDLPESYVQKIRDSAVPQRQPKDLKHLSAKEWKIYRRTHPEIADPKVSPGLYGIPPNMLEEFEKAIVPGSGKVLKGDGS